MRISKLLHRKIWESGNVSEDRKVMKRHLKKALEKNIGENIKKRLTL